MGEAQREDIAIAALNAAGTEQQMREKIATAYKRALDDVPQAKLISISQRMNN